MRAVVQRVASASVNVDGEVLSQIDRGLLVFLAVRVGDGVQEADWMVNKLAGLRVFENSAGKFEQSVTDIGGQVLVVSQFTLYANTRKGRRPSFTEAAEPAHAEALFCRVADGIAERGIRVGRGRFGARMRVGLVNDGPVTIIIDT